MVISEERVTYNFFLIKNTQCLGTFKESVPHRRFCSPHRKTNHFLSYKWWEVLCTMPPLYLPFSFTQSTTFFIGTLSDMPVWAHILPTHLTLFKILHFSFCRENRGYQVYTPSTPCLSSVQTHWTFLYRGEERHSCAGRMHRVDSGIHPGLRPRGFEKINYPCIRIRAPCFPLVPSP